VLTATSGLAIGYWTYLFTRMGVGIGEASCARRGQALIGDLYPAEKRGASDGHFHGRVLPASVCFALIF
jgi:MFS family permease